VRDPVRARVDNLDRDKVEDLLFHLLRTFYQFEQIEVLEFDLSYELIYILKMLRRNDGMRISDIAEEMKIKVFTATRLADQLEKRELIKRKRDSVDKRNILVTITAKGKRIVKKIEDHAINLIFGNMGSYSEDEIHVIFNTIKNLDHILGVEPSKFLPGHSE
jgi:DNA-binding MarR family transcriptional regulator